MNRFKGSDLVDCLKNYGQFYNIAQEAVIKTIPRNKKWKKKKWLTEETLQIAEERSESQGRKGKTERRIPEKSNER